MTVQELASQLNQMLINGIHPDTTVVISYDDGSGWLTVDSVTNPDDDEEFIWVTLFPGREADSRTDG